MLISRNTTSTTVFWKLNSDYVIWVLSLIALGNLVIEPAKRRVTVKNAEVKLAPKEYDLLMYLVENKDLILTRDQILDRVWGMEYEGYDRAVDTHIKKLRAALGDYGSHIETVIKTGYKWRS